MVTQNLLRNTMRIRPGKTLTATLPPSIAAIVLLLTCFLHPGSTQEAGEPAFGPFADPELPYLMSAVDARAWGPDNNLTPRGIVMKAGAFHFCFDTDLLRISAAWISDENDGFLTESGTVAGMSWADGRKKQGGGQKKLPTPIGTPLFTTAVVPGVVPAGAKLVDRRTPAPDANEVGRGPDGHWRAIEFGGYGGPRFKYDAHGCEVIDVFTWSSIRNGQAMVERKLFYRSTQTVDMVLCRVPEGLDPEKALQADRYRAPLADGGTMEIDVAKSRHGAKPRLSIRDGHLVMELGHGGRNIHISYRFTNLKQADRKTPPGLGHGDWQHWNQGIRTDIKPTRAFPDGWQLDEIELPEPNPWRRRVRVADIDFSANGIGYIVTTDGDVWRMDLDPDADSASVDWRRIAGGLSEPQSLCVVDGEPYVFDRTGLIRIEYTHPGLGPTHVLHNHCNLFAQTCNTREFPMAMERLDGDFILAKGGQQAGTKGKHNGMVLRVPRDGKSFEVVASGLRQPYIGVANGRIYSSDQQGHWVPTTPVHEIRPGAFYGSQESYPDTKNFPEVTEPLLWLPHQACQSGTGTLPFPGDTNSILYLDYYRGEVFRVVTRQAQTSGHKLWSIPGPLLAGTVHDGDIYLCGYQVWGHAGSERDAGLWRLRRSEQRAAADPEPRPEYALASKQGVFVQFTAPLPPNAEDLGHWSLERWNYQRTAKYGSPRFKSDGKPGSENLYPSAALLNPERDGLFLVVPGMAVSDQLVVTRDFGSGTNTVYLSPRLLPEAATLDLPVAEIPADISRIAPVKRAATGGKKEVSLAAGKALYTSMGCIACHSIDGTTVGKTGPSWKALADSKRALAGGGTATADDAYLRTAIYEPGKHKPVGYAAADIGMPSYLGLLDEDDVASLILYMRSLK